MERVVAFIDGFNLYHSLVENPSYRKYKWLNLRTLIETYVPTKNLREIHYFTALTTWNLQKMVRHKTLIKVLESTDVTVVYGEFRKRERTCPNCRRTYSSHEEKQTDVNIALYLCREAFLDRYDRAFLVTVDSDLVPAIEMVKKTFPGKEVYLLTPIHRNSFALKQVCDFRMKIKEKHLHASQFPDIIPLENGKELKRPPEWQ